MLGGRAAYRRLAGRALEELSNLHSRSQELVKSVNGLKLLG
jgi:hypothetical protein